MADVINEQGPNVSTYTNMRGFEQVKKQAKLLGFLQQEDGKKSSKGSPFE